MQPSRKFFVKLSCHLVLQIRNRGYLGVDIAKKFAKPVKKFENLSVKLAEIGRKNILSVKVGVHHLEQRKYTMMIKHSNWLKLVTRLQTQQEIALFQHSFINLKLVYDIGSGKESGTLTMGLQGKCDYAEF